MSRVVTYCRVSSEEQAEKDISIPAQRKAIHRWVEQSGDSLVQDFVDEGISAYAPADKRPGFCGMVNFCRKHKVDHILVHKLDRFSRNREESILFKSLLRKHGVTVKSITETYDPETPQGFLYEGMIEVINQFYSMNLATETLKGMKENAERGFHNGGRVPYGYRLEKVGDPGRERMRLVEGPEEEVNLVREMFRLATEEGMGAKTITNLLNERQIPAPCSRHWSASTVSNILNNPVYVGDQVWFKSKKVGRDGRAINERDNWITARDAHPTLIEREVFERRRTLATGRAFKVYSSPEHAAVYLLGRLMRCGHCGGNFIGRRQKVTRVKSGVTHTSHYYCSNYLNKGRSVCPSLPIQQSWADSVVLEFIRRKLCHPTALIDLERRVAEKIKSRQSQFDEDARNLDRRVQEIDRRMQNYIRAIGDGIDPAECRQQIAELKARKVKLESDVALSQQEDYHSRALSRNVQAIREFAAKFEQNFDQLSFASRRQIVLQFVDHIEVVDRRIFRVFLKVPFSSGGVNLLPEEPAQPENGLGPCERRSPGRKAQSNANSFTPAVEGGANFLRMYHPRDRGQPGPLSGDVEAP